MDLTPLQWIVGFFAIVGAWTLWTYNSLVTKRNMCRNAFASIDVNLKKRHDLIPQLVATVRGFMVHERDVLEKLTALRTQAEKLQAPTTKRAAVEAEIGDNVGRVLMRAEAYPELKSVENFVHLQRSLVEVEEQLSASRRAYNAATMELNNAVQSAPNNLVAGMFGFEEGQFFEAGSAERDVSEVTL